MPHTPQVISDQAQNGDLCRHFGRTSFLVLRTQACSPHFVIEGAFSPCTPPKTRDFPRGSAPRPHIISDQTRKGGINRLFGRTPFVGHYAPHPLLHNKDAHITLHTITDCDKLKCKLRSIIPHTPILYPTRRKMTTYVAILVGLHSLCSARRRAHRTSS